MNKIMVISLLIFSFINSANLSASSSHKKIHHNYLYFSNNVYSASFTITNHCITPKQPFKNKVKVRKKRILRIDIMAGRHDSKETVGCLTNMFKDKRFIGKYFTFNHNPEYLNFAVKGTLNINGQYFDNVILAQGHGDLINNWWFGGENCKYIENNRSADEVNCTDRNGKSWCFFRGYTKKGILYEKSTNSNEVKVETKACTSE